MQTQKEALIAFAQKMREGAAKTEPLQQNYQDINGTFACALGAAAAACGYKGNSGSAVYRTIYECTGLDLETTIRTEHPISGTPHMDLAYVIVDLNDEHNWTREAIADWVEGIANE